MQRELARCEDVKKEALYKEGKEVGLLLYAEGMIDLEFFLFRLLPRLKESLEDFQGNRELFPFSVEPLLPPIPMESLFEKLFGGSVLLLLNGVDQVFVISLAKIPKRSPEESKTQISILGARDGFTEELADNLALIRKRLKTASLKVEFYSLGRRSHTRVAFLYMEDILNPVIREKVKEGLERIHVDILSSQRDLANALVSKKHHLFPLFSYSGRPDYAAEALIHGRFALIIDGSPVILIGPMNFAHLLHSPEDSYLMMLPVSFSRFLRLAAFILSVFAPGFWIGLTTHHQDMIPLPLLATTIVARKGIPFPAGLEAVIIILLFSLFLEAGLRLPSGIGQTLSVVGGIIIGDAAIAAGITSPIMVVIMSVSAVASFALVNQNLVHLTALFRLFSLLLSIFLGIFGFLLSAYLILIYLAGLRSFGIPYLSPIPGEVRGKKHKGKRRPQFLKTIDRTRNESDMEET